MLGYLLTYTGVMAKLAYALTRLGTSSTSLLALMLISSALLSSVLDNLSVVVTFTPIAMAFNSVGLSSSMIYFALLFGGVFGGNYTPVGSTANIIAISLAEKRKVKIGWGEWLRVALTTTTLQLLVALLWLYVSSHI
jgi:Na+/H+ antiporter NhaD/arsenite permease-like protein